MMTMMVLMLMTKNMKNNMMEMILVFKILYLYNLISNKQQDLQRKDKAQKQKTQEFILANPIEKNPANLRIEMTTSESREEEREREKSL